MRSKLLSVCTTACLAGLARADNIYIMSSDDTTTDGAVVSALISHGHSVAVGVDFSSFDGTQNLTGINTIYLQANNNWTGTAMPQTGQQALVNFVNGGGRLVTCEWMVWLCAEAPATYTTLSSILPFTPVITYGAITPVTYTQVTPNSILNAGLPASFTFPVDNIAGTETYTTTRPGATTFYSSSSSAGITGLSGWAQGSGYVFSFSTVNGPTQLADTNFVRLFSNVMTATATNSCYANCDNSTSPPILNTNDFQCFLNQFAAGSAYANCDNSTVPPTLNVNDFQCFLNKFAIGCN